MKRGIILLLMLNLGWGLWAQCPLHEAVDFTVNDCSGNQIHLFDLLDNGQYVLIDFFYTTCSGCHQTALTMAEAYQAFGCNRHDVVFLEVDDGDSEQECIDWIHLHDVEYPTISGDAGGTVICSQYLINSFPTVILIAPDRSIVIRDLWPPDNLQVVVNALETYGIEQHECTDNVTDQATEITLFPTPASECVKLKGESLGTVAVYNVLGQKINEFATESPELTISTHRYPNGVYFVKTGDTTLRFIIAH